MDDAAAAKTMASLIEGFSDNLADYTHYAMTMWAMAATFPELTMADLFTDDGAKALTRSSTTSASTPPPTPSPSISARTSGR